MKDLRVIGWREWVALPGFEIAHVKVKVDTGARSSCLHAFNVRESRRGRRTWISFDVHPLQRDDSKVVQCRAPLIEYRAIRSSNGKREQRPVVEATIRLGTEEWPIELTLTARDEMGFRMLLGRTAIRGRFVVHPGRSYLIREGMPKKKRKRVPVQGASRRAV